jgi:hypothetical protein
MFSKKPPNCELCGYVKTHTNNVDVLEVISRYGNLFIDGMGSINIIAIEKVLDIEKYKGKEREHIRGKLLIYLSEALKEHQEEYLSDGKDTSSNSGTSRNWSRNTRNK